MNEEEKYLKTELRPRNTFFFFFLSLASADRPSREDSLSTFSSAHCSKDSK